MGKVNDIISVKLEHIQELKARIKQIEDDVQNELQRSRPEEWEIKVKLPRSKGYTGKNYRNHTYFYVKKKGHHANLFHVYGDAEQAWERSLMVAHIPQMISLIREIAGDSSSELSEQAESILENLKRENWVIPDFNYGKCWNGYILERKQHEPTK